MKMRKILICSVLGLMNMSAARTARDEYNASIRFDFRLADEDIKGSLAHVAMLAHCAAPMAAGQEVFTPDDAEQPCATVVQAAPCPRGGWDAIVSGQVSALQSAQLHLAASNGPAVQVRAMPYALLEDV